MSDETRLSLEFWVVTMIGNFEYHLDAGNVAAVQKALNVGRSDGGARRAYAVDVIDMYGSQVTIILAHLAAIEFASPLIRATMREQKRAFESAMDTFDPSGADTGWK